MTLLALVLVLMVLIRAFAELVQRGTSVRHRRSSTPRGSAGALPARLLKLSCPLSLTSLHAESPLRLSSAFSARPSMGMSRERTPLQISKISLTLRLRLSPALSGSTAVALAPCA